MNHPKLSIDVTTLLKWNRPPVGIIRTQLEFVSYILKSDPEARFFCFTDSATLQEVKPQAITEHIQNLQNAKRSFTPTPASPFRHLSLLFQKIIITWRQEGIKALLSKACLRYCPKNLITLLKKLHSSGMLPFCTTPNALAKRLQKRLLTYQIPPNTSYPDFITPDTTIVSLGLDWYYSNYPLLYWLKQRIGFRFVGAFYDAIPITSPHLVQSFGFSQLFFSHLYYLLHLSDKVFCISDFSQGELREIATQHGMPIPPLKTIHLGDSLPLAPSLTSSKNRPHKKDYALYVSTIEARKNHILLLEVWEALLQDSSLEVPDLVMVGMNTWSAKKMWDRYHATPSLHSCLHFYHDVSDEELASLYEGASFTLFPSLVEGWGLGAVESLLYGKPCIISKALALIEATQSLMPALSPDDPKEWVELITQWIKDPSCIESYKSKIKEQFVPRSWEEFSGELVGFART